jgi:hypothetical protein
MHMTSDESWSTACGVVLTSSTAVEADKAACRELMQRRDNEPMGWPAGFALAVFFLACAWAFPRIIKAVS